jgi:fructokinase
MSEVKWGVDLGGTKIEAVALEEERLLARHRIPTEAHLGFDHIVERIKAILDEVQIQVGKKPIHVGVGTPGTRDPHSGLMRGCNTTALNGRDLLAALREKLKCDVTIANDANCFALAEALMGAGRDHQVVFGVIMGTGVGGGAVVSGKVLNGMQGIAGEWGHNNLEPDGYPCYCGRSGCVEVCISGPGLERKYLELGGQSLKLPDIVVRAKQSEAVAMNTLKYLYEAFGKAIAPIVNILDPDVIVLGGGVGNIQDLQTEGARAALPYIFNPNPQIRLAAPQLGDSAGVFGAALLHSS